MDDGAVDGVSVRDVLLISHDASWCAAVTDRLRERGVRAWRASSYQAVQNALELTPLDAALFDIRSLPAPAWFQALELLAHANPAPTIVAWGDHVTPFEAFQLARFAARQLVARRPTPDQAFDVISDAVATPPIVEPHLRAWVGHEPVTTMVDRVRSIFFDQALAMCRDHRTAAARLLGVSRQAVQQRIRTLEEAARERGVWPRIRARRKSG